MPDDDEHDWTEIPLEEGASVLTSISPECQREDCLHCAGTFEHPDAGDATVFCVHVCHKVSAVS
jgi:hypothetical protein